jgi:hypothetical protein
MSLPYNTARYILFKFSGRVVKKSPDIFSATAGFFAFRLAARHMPYRSRRCDAAVMIQAGESRSNPP